MGVKRVSNQILRPQIKDLFLYVINLGIFGVKTYCKLVVIIAEVVNCSKVKIIVINFYVLGAAITSHAYHPVCVQYRFRNVL